MSYMTHMHTDTTHVNRLLFSVISLFIINQYHYNYLAHCYSIPCVRENWVHSILSDLHHSVLYVV